MKGVCVVHPRFANPSQLCDFHRDGGPLSDKCPGHCDFKECSLTGLVTIQVGVLEEEIFCSYHAELGLDIQLAIFRLLSAQ